MSENKKSSGESFAGNVMKYSVATYLGFAITGLALIVKGLLPAEVLGAPVTFMTYTATIMNIGILGLDQALLRFYHEPPAGAEPRQLFAACTRISAAFMMLLGVAGSVFFAQPLAAAFGLGSAGPGIVPLLFLNAALYMLVRYLNVLLRLENDLRAYTAETLWMQGCYNLFYLLPGFFTSNVFVLAVAAILSFGVVAIAFGYKYRAAVFAPLPGAQLGGIARQTVPYGVALAPAQILFSLSSGICLSFVGNASGENAQGLFAFGYSLAQLVTAIQAGFSTYWGPYVYSHYRDEQERICRVHDVLNLLIFGFFCVLVMFEDIVFVIFPDKRGCLAIFPLLMLAVVFNILCEGTVYGNSIARKPWHDTIGIGLGALSNFGLCALLVPAFGLTGAALALAILPPVVRLIMGIPADWGEWVYRALTFLVISCPCALVISIPLSFFGGIGGASARGILIKGSSYLEMLAKTDRVVFDKTGTLTRGTFAVTAVHPAQPELSEQALLQLAAAAEQFSDHPVSQSLRRAAGELPADLVTTDAKELAGHGVTAQVGGRSVAAGNTKLMDTLGLTVPAVDEIGTVIHVAADGTYLGYIVISDEPKAGSREAVARLRADGVRVVMLTGDRKSAADAVAEELGIAEVHSELLPEDKVTQVERLLGEGAPGKYLAFVGDGINDAPVLARADLGAAMGGIGSDAAIEAADIVLMDDDPRKLSLAMRISRKTMRLVWQNIVFALAVKAVCLVLGALGIANMWAAIFADVGVMIIAVLNAIRALNVKKL